MVPEAVRNGRKTLSGMPVKPVHVQVAMKIHLSQPVDVFDEQHGISSAISSIVTDISCLAV